MKNITFILSLLLIIFSCKNDDDTLSEQTCGCESETIVTISETAELNGKLFYKNDTLGNNFNNQKFWIVYIENNCSNCIHSLIVCNENILSSIANIPTFTNINDIIGSSNELNNAIDIQFSGKLKTINNGEFVDWIRDSLVIRKKIMEINDKELQIKLHISSQVRLPITILSLLFAGTFYLIKEYGNIFLSSFLSLIKVDSTLKYSSLSSFTKHSSIGIAHSSEAACNNNCLAIAPARLIDFQ